MHLKERAKAFGVFGAIAGAGSAIGLILGGVITNYLTWRWTMYINVIIAVVAVIGAVVFVTDRAARRSVRVDYLGTVLGCGGLLALVYGFTKAASDGWGNTMTLVLFAIRRRRPGPVRLCAGQGAPAAAMLPRRTSSSNAIAPEVSR